MLSWNGRNPNSDGPRAYFSYLADVEAEEKERRGGRSYEEEREMAELLGFGRKAKAGE